MKYLFPKTYILLGVLFLSILACTSEDETPVRLNKILTSVKITTNGGSSYTLNYKYDSQGRLSEITEDGAKQFSFTYTPDGRVEKLSLTQDSEYTFSYTGTNTIPSKIISQTNSTSEIYHHDKNITWNYENGNSGLIEGGNLKRGIADKFKDENNITWTLKNSSELKNGLEFQHAINIPLLLTGQSQHLFVKNLGLVSSIAITELHKSEGFNSTYQYATDDDGYITTLKTEQSNATFHYQQ